MLAIGLRLSDATPFNPQPDVQKSAVICYSSYRVTAVNVEKCCLTRYGKIRFYCTLLKETWAEMEKLVEKGLVRNIGMSNFNSKQLTDLMEECKLLPAVLQV